MPKLSELERIDAITRILGPSRVAVGIGDDAAVLKWKARDLVVTTDSQVEGVHFSRFSKPEEIGHRLLAVNLSDLAAMAAIPRAAVVSLAVPKGCRDAFLLRLYRGLGRLARQHHVEIVGGNLSRSPSKMFFDLTLMGESAKKPILRSGARPGHCIAVTGTLGDSAVGLKVLQRLGAKARTRYPKLVRAHLTPQPLVAFGQRLGGLASSCIDVSDGLSSELHHLAKQSRVTLRIEGAALPVSQELLRACEQYRLDPILQQLHGGEGFNLLFTYPVSMRRRVQAAARSLGVRVTEVGRVGVRSRHAVLMDADCSVRPLSPLGFQHF